MDDPFGENVEIEENYFADDISGKSKCPKQKILFFLLGTFLLVIVILLGFLLINLRSSDKKGEEDKYKDKDKNKELTLSKINCNFL